LTITIGFTPLAHVAKDARAIFVAQVLSHDEVALRNMAMQAFIYNELIMPVRYVVEGVAVYGTVNCSGEVTRTAINIPIIGEALSQPSTITSLLIHGCANDDPYEYGHDAIMYSYFNGTVTIESNITRSIVRVHYNPLIEASIRFSESVKLYVHRLIPEIAHFQDAIQWPR